MSLRYVYEQDAMIARFVAQMIPHVDYRGFPAGAKSIGVINADGMLIAGVVYYSWNPVAGTVEAAAAALPRMSWVSRETLRRAFGYAFDAYGCQMLKMNVLAGDERVLRQLAVCGFKFQTIERNYGRDKDGVLCTLTVEDWANNKFNKRPEPRVVEPHPLDIPDWLRRDKEAA